MTTRYRLVTVVVLAGLLLGLTAPAIALAQGPGAGGVVVEPMHHHGGGPGHGGHQGGGWGQNAMFDAFATALQMTPAQLTEWIQAGHTIAELVSDETSRQALVDAVVAQMTEWTEACLQAGHIDEEQQAWMEEHLRWHVDWLIDNPEALLYESHHSAMFGSGWGGGFGGLMWAAAEVLDLSPWDIRDALHEGQTIAELAQQVASDTGASVDDLIQAIIDTFVEPRAEALAAAVAAGSLTAEQADALLAYITTQAEWLVYNTPYMGEFGHGYGGGGCH